MSVPDLAPDDDDEPPSLFIALHQPSSLSLTPYPPLRPPLPLSLAIIRYLPLLRFLFVSSSPFSLYSLLLLSLSICRTLMYCPIGSLYNPIERLIPSHKIQYGLYDNNKLHLYSALPRSTEDSFVLETPKTKLKSFGDRAFSSYGPRIWNSLPKKIRDIDKIEIFKKQLKHHLFLKTLCEE